MPVIDLADYLGMPQQAPANPVFNQTRKSTGVASLDREIDDFYKGAAAIDQLRSLQRQAPVFEAQKAQIAYDKVAQDARDLRMKQEIEAQVERAANELAGGNLNPESEDFGAKYRDLATRNPLAFSDPRFSNVAGLYAAQNQNYQAARKQQMDAEARAAQARIDAENSAYAFGVPAGRITPEMSIRDINIERGKVKTAGTGTRGGSASAEERRLSNILNVRAKEYEDAKQRVEDFDLKDTDQEFIDARNAWKEASKKYIQFNETGGVPVAATPTVQPTTQQQVSPAAAAARSALTGMASVATPYSLASLPASAIVSALPTVEAPKQTSEKEVIIDINDPSADENTYMAAIDSGNNSLEIKKQALAKLQQFAKSPPPRSDLTVGEAIRRRANLQALAEQAKQEVDAYPVVQQYNKAWSGIKSTMDKTLDEFAKSISSSKDQVINSLKSGELIQGIPGYETSDADQGGVSVYRLLSDYFADKMGQERSFGMNRPGLSQTVDELEVFKASPFAAKIGMRGPLGLGGSKTWTDVLDVYLAEKTKPVATAAPQVNVAPSVMEPGQVMIAPGGGTITRNK